MRISNGAFVKYFELCWCSTLLITRASPRWTRVTLSLMNLHRSGRHYAYVMPDAGGFIRCYSTYTCSKTTHIKGILSKGPYRPCVSMAGRALLAGYPGYSHWRHRSSFYYVHAFEIIFYKYTLNSIKRISYVVEFCYHIQRLSLILAYVASEWGLRRIKNYLFIDHSETPPWWCCISFP